MPASWPRQGPSAEETRKPIILMHPQFVTSRTCSSISLHVGSGTPLRIRQTTLVPERGCSATRPYRGILNLQTHSSQTSQTHERTQMHRATRGSAKLSSSLTRVSPSQPPCTSPSPKATCSDWLLITMWLTDFDSEKLRHHGGGNNDIKNN
jgi:hypothetical protein